MRIGVPVIALFLVVAKINSGAAANDLFDAVRAGDARLVKALLKSGTDLSARDDIGATPLMYAAALPSQDCLRALLDGGADVNASTKTGSTALMWATGDAATVGLLLDRGAEVNAKTKIGTTALLTATRRSNAEAMKLLLAHGADPKAATQDGSDLLRAAYVNPGAVFNGSRSNQEIIQIVAEAGIELRSADQLGPTPLLAGLGDSTILQRILGAGAVPNEVTRAPGQTVPNLEFGVAAGDKDFALVLLEHGANPNAKSTRDLTPLMVAANAPHPDPAMMRLLINKGADVNAHDNLGRTVLDWAMMQGEPEVVRSLRGAGAKSGAVPSPSPSPVAQPRSVRGAVETAIPRLQPIGPLFNKHAACISCHNHSLPEIAVTLARARRISVDAATAAHPAKATLDIWKTQRENLMLSLESGIGGFVENVTYGLWGLSEEGVPANSTTDAVAYRLSALQRPDGSWQEVDTRPPLGGISPIVFTALAIRGLDVYSPLGLLETTKTRIALARKFLRKALPADTQDESFKLLGLIWSGASAAEISRQSRRVRTLQRGDGGWGQLPTMASDSYSSGQTLYALRAAGASIRSSDYRKGVAYLLRTQLDDGTWFVRSRATIAFQAPFDSGFPHGTDQFISAAATSWAVIALSGDL